MIMSLGNILLFLDNRMFDQLYMVEDGYFLTAYFFARENNHKQMWLRIVIRGGDDSENK